MERDNAQRRTEMNETPPWIGHVVRHRRRIHICVGVLTILLLPGALTVLSPFDLEDYNLESPELMAEQVLLDDFAAANIIMGFLTTIRHEGSNVGDVNQEMRVLQDGSIAVEHLPQPASMLPYKGNGMGVEEPTGGVFNLTVLREIDVKTSVARESVLSAFHRPFASDVTGLETDGVSSISDMVRAFMANNTTLTQTGRNILGQISQPRADWTDCGILECLTFDDEKVTQRHIDLAVHRIVNATPASFLRMVSLDRTFLEDEESGVFGPIGGVLDNSGAFMNASWSEGRWSASSTWILVQYDRPLMEDEGWTFSWKDSRQESGVHFTEDGIVIGGYRMTPQGLVIHPPRYSAEQCREWMREDDSPCSVEWGLAAIEQDMRVSDELLVTLSVNALLQVEVNRELQQSGALLIMMVVAVALLLYLSLRRWSDVAIVGTGLFVSLVWMQGWIGYLDQFGTTAGIQIIHRSQFSYLLPILILALGIDDALHALHRYKEERRGGGSAEAATEVTLHRVGRAILLTSLTTIAAFSANLGSNIPALRSFAVEAILGVSSALLVTGMWVPLLRLSIDLSFEGDENTDRYDVGVLISAETVGKITKGASRHSIPILLIAVLVTMPALWGMSQLEGDFKIEDFLDIESDFGQSIVLVNERFTEEGEPAAVLLEGDVLHPSVIVALGEFDANMNNASVNDPDRFARLPDGRIDVRSIHGLVFALRLAHVENPSLFESYGWNESLSDNGVGCSTLPGSGLFEVKAIDLDDRGCLTFGIGYATIAGIPETSIFPLIPAGVVRTFISPKEDLDPTAPWMTIDGKQPTYHQTAIRFGIRQPEEFSVTRLALDELERDLEPLYALTNGDPKTRGDPETTGQEGGILTWVIPTDKPVTRYIAASLMQNELQRSLVWGSLFCLITLIIGFRSIRQALITTLPILTVIMWLYGSIHFLGYSINPVTVAIAAISLGVGIDYCIHVTERYREERARGADLNGAIAGIGSACGLALIGAAASDATGFLIISRSTMGFFGTFGMLSALMIGLSLVASLLLTTALLTLTARDERASK